MEGFLIKTLQKDNIFDKGKTDKYEELFVICRQYDLVYYSVENPQTVGCLPITPELAVSVKFRDVRKPDRFKFEISVGGTTYIFGTQEEAKRQLWVTAIQMQIDQTSDILKFRHLPHSPKSFIIYPNPNDDMNEMVPFCGLCGVRTKVKDLFKFGDLAAVCMLCLSDLTAFDPLLRSVEPILENYPGYAEKKKVLPFIYHQYYSPYRLKQYQNSIKTKTHTKYPPYLKDCIDANGKVLIKILKLRLRDGQFINGTVDGSMKRLIHYACEEANLEVIKLLCSQHDIDIITQDIEGHTPLHSAVLGNSKECVLYLLSKGARLSLNTLSKTMEVPLELAWRKKCNNASQAIIEHEEWYRSYLLEGKNMKPEFLGFFVSSYGATALHWAAKLGKIDTLRNLLRTHKIDIDIKDRYGHTPLHYAVESNQHECCKFLVESGADVNQQNYLGFSPFHYLINKRNINTIKLFMTNGADAGLKDFVFDVTPTHLAMLEWQQQDKITNLFSKFMLSSASVVIDTLIEYRANFCVQDAEHQTPLIMSEGHQLEHRITNILHAKELYHACQVGDYEKVQGLCKLVDINTPDTCGNTPLHFAITSKNDELVAFLLQIPNINRRIKNHIGKTALEYRSGMSAVEKELILQSFESALKRNDLRMLKSLFEQDRNLKGAQRFSNDQTALQIAAESGSLNCLQFLCEKKFGLDICDDGNTALHIVARKGNIPALKMLVETVPSLVNKKDKDGNTPLHLWCSFGYKDHTSSGNAEVIEPGTYYLMVNGASVTEKNLDNKTAYDIARAKKDDRTLERAIEFHVLGRNIITAVTNGNAEEVNNLIVQVIEEKKFDLTILLNYRDKQKKTPLHWALDSRFFYFLDHLYLLGADAYSRDVFERTPYGIAQELKVPFEPKALNLLHYCAKGDITKAKPLLGLFGNNYPTTSHNESLIYLACVGGIESMKQELQPGGYPHVVSHLLRIKILRKTVSTVRTITGNTSLHGACYHANVKCVKYLLQSGANPDVMNDHCDKPIDLLPIKRMTESDPDFLDKKEKTQLIVKLLLRQQLVMKLVIACKRGDRGVFNEVMHAVKDRVLFKDIDKTMEILLKKEEPKPIEEPSFFSMVGGMVGGFVGEIVGEINEIKQDIFNSFTVTLKQKDPEPNKQWLLTVPIVVTSYESDQKKLMNIDNKIKESQERVNLQITLVNAKWSGRNSLLHLAVKYDHFEIAKLLLENRAELDKRNYKERTPKELAGIKYKGVEEKVKKYNELFDRYEHFKKIGEFVKNGAIDSLTNYCKTIEIDTFFDMKDSSHFTLLHWAVIRNKQDVVAYLIEAGFPLLPDSTGHTPVHLAALLGHSVCLEIILKNRNDQINEKSDQNYRPISLACFFHDDGYKKCVVDLTNQCAKIPGTNQLVAPLIMASKCGNATAVHFLLENKAMIDEPDTNNRTALMHAVYQDHLDVIELLLSNNGDVNISDNKGDTPLLIACRKGNAVLVKAIVKGGGANLNHHNNVGISPLHHAVLSGQYGCVKSLVDQHCNIEIPFKQEENDATPIMIAIYLLIVHPTDETLQIFKCLVMHGAKMEVSGVVVDTKISPCQTHYIIDNERSQKILATWKKDKKKISFEDEEDLIHFMNLCNPKFQYYIEHVHQAKSWWIIKESIKSGDVSNAGDALKKFLPSQSKQFWLDAQDFSPDGYGRTLLHWAAYRGAAYIAIELLKHGAHTNITDNDHKTPLELALSQKHDIFENLFQNFEDTKNFLEKIQYFLSFDSKADKEEKFGEFEKFIKNNEHLLNQTLSDTGTALHYFAQAGFTRHVKLLVNMQADLRICNEDGDTPLHIAAKNNSIKTLHFMGKTFPKLDTRNKRGETIQSILEDNDLNYMKVITSGRIQNRDMIFPPRDESSSDLSDEDTEKKKKKKEIYLADDEVNLDEKEMNTIEALVKKHMDEWVRTSTNKDKSIEGLIKKHMDELTKTSIDKEIESSDGDYLIELERYKKILITQKLVEKKTLLRVTKAEKQKEKKKKKKERKKVRRSLKEKRMKKEENERNRNDLNELAQVNQLKAFDTKDVVLPSTRYLLMRLKELLLNVTRMKVTDVEFTYEAIIEILHSLEF